jgi:hypothetical protein
LHRSGQITQKWVEGSPLAANIPAMAWRYLLAAVVLACGGIVTLPAGAVENAPATPIAPPAQATTICMSRGQQYKIGDYACLPGCHGRQRYARCDAIAEAASWTFISDVCPMADLAPPAPGAYSPAPVVTAMNEIPVQMATTPAGRTLPVQGPYCDDEFH